MNADVILVGGGLANCLIAYRLTKRRPELAVIVVESEAQLAGNHLWSFHSSDLSADERQWIAPLVVAAWPGYEVRFPAVRRQFDGGYNSISSERLAMVVRTALERAEGQAEHELMLGVPVVDVQPESVTLADGRRLEAPLVIDGRGFEASAVLALAYQKFLGLEVELAEDHGLSAPIVMDATVDQRDGYRFLYTLPLTGRSLLIEDTRYSDGADLDLSEMRVSIETYADETGWKARRVVREEQGVLPIVLAGDIDAYWASVPSGVPRAGLRGLLFHPTTGYSLPDAVRLADRVASMSSPTSQLLDRLIRRRSVRQWKRQAFFRLLNRMLFGAAQPAERYRVLERFYRLPGPLIERFYAGSPTALDRARVLVGRPPVPIGKALRCVPEARLLRLSARAH